MKTNNLLKHLMVIALLSAIVFAVSPTTALAASPDNDHTPIYGPNGELLYPIYTQSQRSQAMRVAAARSNRSCGLPTPTATGRFGDVKREDNWARVAVTECDGKLAGVAWSAWSGRDPISTGHDSQNLWVDIEVVDLSTGQIIKNLDLHRSNNPRTQGVLSYTFNFEIPADGHVYELRMSAKMRQNTCGNGSGSASDSVTGSKDPKVTLQVSTDCTGTHFTGQVEAPMNLVYRLSNSQSGTIPVDGDFDETVNWIPQIQGSCGPHEVSAEAELVLEGQTVTSDQASDKLDCGREEIVAQCTLTSSSDGRGNTLVNLGAIDEDGNSVPIEAWQADHSFGSDKISASSPDLLPAKIRFPKGFGEYWVQFEVLVGDSWRGGQTCRIEHEVDKHTTGQYQDFIGAVPFGTFTPDLEPGKEYFDGARSVMFNVEFITEDEQGDVVFRFNGQEVSDITTSIFNANTFRQVQSRDGRAVTSFDNGMTKLIAYRYGAEQAKIFQSIAPKNNRWIHPLDQPFEHKYDFELELHGPAGTTDLLVYGDNLSHVRYNENGIAVAAMAFTEPGLVALYPVTETGTSEVEWTTVEAVSYPISSTETVSYDFAETGLYHYRLTDAAGQVVAEPSTSSHIEFNAEPGMTYYAQLAYPATSLFVGLYDDMKFQHPDYWTMPVDGRFEHDFEFHLDYHRLNDPDLGNDHIRGEVVIDALYLTNGTTSVAQQFPYGRHDGSLPGVTIVGIPNVSMAAFCQRPGMHEVVYWGGWENESYYLPHRGWVFDQELYDEWTEDQRGDCIDTAQRVNMELARQGLRTDHTYSHHGELSQGYQMTEQNIWSAYNLAGMRPPHIGKFLKPGTVLSYYEDPADTLFWAWDLDNGGLADGIGEAELQHYVESLGPVVYGDQTGIHPPEEL